MKIHIVFIWAVGRDLEEWSGGRLPGKVSRGPWARERELGLLAGGRELGVLNQGGLEPGVVSQGSWARVVSQDREPGNVSRGT